MLLSGHMKRGLIIGIGVAAAVAFFLLFFGKVFFPFPKIFVLDLFQQSAVQSAQRLPQQTAPVAAPAQPREEMRLNGLVTLLDLSEGTGLEAVKGKEIAVGYIGIFEDATSGEAVEFDRNTDKTKPFVFTLGAGQVVPGFEAGIEGMREGGIRVFHILPEAGYGGRQVGNIPPNTTLQFVVELYEVR